MKERDFIHDCENCGEPTNDDEFSCFKYGRKELLVCPACAEKRREEEPKSEVL
jgi:ribosome-binding protein aMBF1 (putative translation factor)